MIIKGAVVYDGCFDKKKLDIKIENTKISEIGEELSGEFIDCSDCTVIPGFIDIHIHGTNGADSSDEDKKSIDIISKNLVRHGVTSFCPTTMTLPHSKLLKIFSNIADYKGNENGAYIHGINMEGPFISFEKKGAQSGDFIRKPDIDEFNTLNNICKISLIDVAPEIEGALSFSREASKTSVVSVAHTNASYNEALAGFENGFTHATHLFNAMTGLTARTPGVIGAVFDKGIASELICDGFHIAPSVLRLAFKVLGEDKTIIISDSMRSADLPDGEYTLGGQTIYVNDGKALLADGTIAASTSNIYDEFINALNFGIDEKQVIKSATINPAKAIGVDDITGSIDVNKNADLLVLDNDKKIKFVFVRGKLLYDYRTV